MKKISSKLLHSNPWLSLHYDMVESGDRTKTYYTVSRPDSVIIIPITPENEIILVQIFRYPTQKHSWELPCGAIETGESDPDAAKREMLEETGLRIETLTQIGTFHPLPALTAQQVIVFMTRLSQEEMKKITHKQSEGEVKKIQPVSLGQLSKLVKNREITDGLTLSALQIFSLQ